MKTCMKHFTCTADGSDAMVRAARCAHRRILNCSVTRTFHKKASSPARPSEATSRPALLVVVGAYRSGPRPALLVGAYADAPRDGAALPCGAVEGCACARACTGTCWWCGVGAALDACGGCVCVWAGGGACGNREGLGRDGGGAAVARSSGDAAPETSHAPAEPAGDSTPVPLQ